MRLEQRVIFNTTDISEKVNDFRSGSQTFNYVDGQFLYIGTLLPFNHLFFELGVANTVPSNVNVEIWWANSWSQAIDINDGTQGLFQSGKIFFSSQINRGWDWEREAKTVIGLSAFEIYNMFWTRLSWDETLNPLTVIKYIGQKFSDDATLYSYFPDLQLPDIIEAFGTGKTDWNEQHYMAAEHIVKDLTKRDIIKARQQILDPYLLKDAACYKVAEIVYRGMGKPYFDLMQEARDRYKDEMNFKFYNVDLNQDSRLDDIERVISTGFLTR